MATTALYRIRSGEVVKISLKGQPFSDRDQTYWGVLTDPTCPDGTAVRETLANGTLGPLRVLGWAKHYPGTGATISNATQAQIDSYAAAETADENAQDAERVAQLFQNHPQWRKAFKALLKRILFLREQEATQWNTYRAQVAAASSLADLKTRVASNTADLPTYTLAQAVTALLTDISADD